MKLKFRRLGTFVIDSSISGMFYRIIVTFLAFFLRLTGENFLLDIFIILIYLVIFIAIYLIYQNICYAFMGNSLGRKLMNLEVYNNDNTELNQQEYMQREFYKIYLVVATLTMYVYYYVIVGLFKKDITLWHDKKMNTYVL